MSSMNMYYIY